MINAMIFWIPIIMGRPLITGRKTIWLDSVLILAGVASIAAVDAGFRIEVSWQRLPLHAALGIFVFVLSVCSTTRHPTQYLRNVRHALRNAETRTHKHAAGSAALTAVFEEIVWRAVFQTILSMAIGTFWAVPVIAVTFSLVHRHRTSGLSLQFVELLGFSLILGVLFAFTHDLMAVVAPHAIRNYLVSIQGSIREAQ